MLAAPTPAPVATQAPARTDPCGGSQELLKKYLSASPCVFVAGQAAVQMTYSGTNTVTSHAFGYPGALLHVGVSPTSQITIALPSFSQITSVQNGTAAGTDDMEFRYKQLVYSNPKAGILGGVLATYQAPTGSPALTAPGPSYEINPLLNIALNQKRTIAENLSFPVTNAPAAQPGGSRSWSFAPQAVTVWRSPGGTLLAFIAQYGFSNDVLYLTFNTAQLISRNFQIQGTYGANNAPVDYVNPVEDIPHAGGSAHSRSFTVGFSYLVGNSEAPAR
jgi:hypothetical protein